MITDEKLIEMKYRPKVKAGEKLYVGCISDRKDLAPRQYLSIPARNKNEATAFAHEYALRLLGLEKNSYLVILGLES